MTEHFESVKTMISNLRSEDPEARLNSMRGIHLIASTLGPERVRDELLPYLTDYLDENDEVLRVFANALGTMLHEVGGIGHVRCLFSPLELLVSLDEITVRDEAVSSLRTIGNHLFRESGDAGVHAQQDFVTLILRLGRATPQCRSSAASLVSVAYPHVATVVKGHLMSLFVALCKDEEIMVRRSACIALGKYMCEVLGSRSTELVTALTTLSRDTSDGVRLQVVAAAIAVLRVIPQEAHASILPAVKGLAGDNSWRVRYTTADHLGGLAEVMSPSDVKQILPIFYSLTQDAEAEIRASAVFSMAGVLATCRDAGAKRDILLAGCKLVNDTSSHVRMCLASSVLKSVVHVAKEHWGNTIVPTCTQLLKDSEADVRLALVSGFGSMGNTLEARELAPKLVPIVVALAEDPKWRIREVVVSQIPYLITSLGKETDDVVEVCVQHLVDRVAAIRDAAVQSCCRLVLERGVTWSRNALFPRLRSLSTAGNYLHRVTLAHIFFSLAGVAGVDRNTIVQLVLPMLRQLAQDNVSNVRLNCAKAMVALKQTGQLIDSDVEGLLVKLRKDADMDVSDAASKG